MNNQIPCGQAGCPRFFPNLRKLRIHLHDECTYPAAVYGCETMDIGSLTDSSPPKPESE